MFTVSPTVFAQTSTYLDNVITYQAQSAQFEGQNVSVTVQVSNTDAVAHTLSNVQADFYDATLDQLGDDPADHIVTAGFVPGGLSLAAGETQTVTISAQNFLGTPILSVGYGPTVGT
jgi:hypothetical protein